MWYQYILKLAKVPESCFHKVEEDSGEDSGEIEVLVAKAVKLKKILTPDLSSGLDPFLTPSAVICFLLVGTDAGEVSNIKMHLK